MGCLVCVLAAAAAQQTDRAPANPNDTDNANAREITSRDVSARFKVNVNLVTVRAVVRDSKGHVLGNLKREDFHIFDNGKPQVITSFAAEASKGSARGLDERATAEAENPGIRPVFTAPEHYIAYVVDDLHAQFNELVLIKQAIEASFSSLQAADRAGIFTTSGIGALDFTDDHTALRTALGKVRLKANLAENTTDQCPYMTYYMADLIINKGDKQALAVVAQELNQCLLLRDNITMAESLARSEALKELQKGNIETRTTLDVLSTLVRRMSALPGRRVILLASPGFIVPDHHLDEVEVMDRAIRSEVVINTIDARGLYVATAMKAETPGLVRRVDSKRPQSDRALLDYVNQSERIQADVLESFADGTGGTFIHNTNDLEGGIRRLTAAPEFVYVLTFAPQGLKRDGKFHSLKVSVNVPGTTVTARRGYHAPVETADPEVALHQELEDMFFSQQEINEIPFEMQSEFFKDGNGKARLSLVTRVQIHELPFRKEADRSCDQLNVVSGIFDRNGTMIEGQEKVIELRLRDRTLDQLRAIAVKASFEVDLGHYMLRVVVRDTEGKQLSAKSATIEIP